MRKNIRVTTNDPAMKEFSLTVNGTVKTFARIYPPRVRFRGKVNEPSTTEATITPSDEFKSKFKILKTSFEQETDITCAIETKMENDETTFVLSLTSPNKKSGRFSNTLVVLTNHPKMSKIKIPITGYVAEPANVTEQPKPMDSEPDNTERKH